MPASKRRSPRGLRSRESIVAAAAAEFADRGYRGATIAGIAERAGLTPSGVMHHYRTKRALLDAVLEQRFDTDSAILSAADAAESPTVPGYLTLARRSVGDPTWMRLLTVLTAEGLIGGDPASLVIRERYRRIRAQSAARVARLRPDLPDPERVATILLAAMDGLQSQHLYEPDIDVVDSVARLLEVFGLSEAHPDARAEPVPEEDPWRN